MSQHGHSGHKHDGDGHHHGEGHSQHGHDHGHHHHHDLGEKDYNWAFAIGVGLNTVFVVIEAFYGYFSDSLALMADAGHNLSDVAGLLLAWGAVWLSKKKPTSRYTYGFRSSSILAALLNALILLIAVGGIIWEALIRLRAPAEVAGQAVILVAGIGIVINAMTAYLFASGRKGDLNIRGAYLHMAADALVSVGVVISGIVIYYTGWNMLDPIVSLIISAVILFGTWDLLKSSVRLAVAAVPQGINIKEINAHLSKLPGVSGVHDLHVWALSTRETALTVHLIMPKGHPGDKFLKDIGRDLEAKFKIVHPTIQIEIGDSGDCPREPDEVL
jgi:cobalt-zinc-cadmium efflux system protein